MTAQPALTITKFYYLSTFCHSLGCAALNSIILFLLLLCAGFN